MVPSKDGDIPDLAICIPDEITQAAPAVESVTGATLEASKCVGAGAAEEIDPWVDVVGSVDIWAAVDAVVGIDICAEDDAVEEIAEAFGGVKAQEAAPAVVEHAVTAADFITAGTFGSICLVCV
jgi:hypothetical protein